MKNLIKILFLLGLALSPYFGQAEENPSQTFLVWGGETGWLGKKIISLLQEQKQSVYAAKSRMENREAVESEIKEVQPDYIINCAGVTGTPNVDWCEDHSKKRSAPTL